MDNKKIFLILYLLLPLLAIIPPVLATPEAVITDPSTFEVVVGTKTILWDVNSPDNSMDLNARLSYSVAPNAGAEHYKIADLNLFDVCDFGTELYWTDLNKHNTGMEDITDNFYASGTNVFEYGGNWNHIVVGLDQSGSIQSTLAHTYNTTTFVWDVNVDINSSLYNDAFIYKNVFVLNEKLYALGTKTGKVISKSYDSPTKTWNPNYDINRGLEDVNPDYTLESYPVFDFFPRDWLITVADLPGSPDFNILAKSYYWIDTGVMATSYWQRDDSLVTDFNVFWEVIDTSEEIGTAGSDIFTYNGVLYAIIRKTQSPSGSAGTRVNAIEYTPYGWVLNSDLNEFDFGVGDNSTYWFNIVPFQNDVLTLFGTRLASGLLYGYVETFDYVTDFKTSKNSSCSYDWDTTGIFNDIYYIDLNVLDLDTGTHFLTSSALIQILNWTDSDITCDCVSNCSSCTLDVNAFVVVPTSESGDVEIKVTNLTSEKNIGYRIANSLNTGNQYKIFTTDADNFADELWSLDDTLTFGSTNYNSVQKIWNSGSEEYSYNFSQTLLSTQVQYYKFDYYEPAYHWFTVNDSYWFVQNPPNSEDYNGLLTDLYGLSTKTDLTNFLTQPKFPEMTSNLANKNFVFQFTAKGDTSFTGEFTAGIVATKPDASPTALNIFGSYKTTTLQGLENGYIKMESAVTTPRDLYIQNYTVSERGYFSRPLTLTDDDGSPLPILISDNNTQFKYIIEGKDFMIHSEYFDPDGDIDRIEVTAYFTSVTAGNKFKKWTFEATETGRIPIRKTLGGLVDLTPNASDLTVIITTRLIDSNASYYEIQTDQVKLRQFPKTSQDLTFNVIQGNQLIGEYPKGHVKLQTIAPETIIGVELQFQDSSDNNNADFNKTFYKNTDFSCISFDCSFDYELDDFIFSASGVFRVDGWALVTTEEQDLVSPFNDLLHDIKTFNVSFIALNTARIFQTWERTDHKYNNDEVIPIVVQLMDSTGKPASLVNKLNVKLQLEECSAATGNKRCRTIDLNYSPNSTMFDETTGYTYFHFRQVFLEEDYSRLSDGNHFRIKALLSDPSNTYETLYTPVLADRCQEANPLTWLANLLTMDFFSWGCNDGEFTNKITALYDNNAHEEYITIDATHSAGAPTQFWWTCSQPNQNNLYSDVLAQDVVCWTWYLLGEAPIDEFKFYLTNNNSDLTVEEDELKQFIEVSVPYEYIYFNDMKMMQEALKQEYNTDIDTVGEVIQYQLTHYLGGFAPTVNIAGDFLTATGLIGNVGFEMGAIASGNVVDFNYATPLDPRVISGVVTYKISNINVINKKDYEEKYPDLKQLSASKFTLWADLENVNLKSEPITIDVFVSDYVKVLSIESNAKLIIDEIAQTNPINSGNLDANMDANVYFSSLPTKITFRAISDLIYNNKLTFDRRYLILPYSLVLTQKTFCGWFGFGCWGDGLGDLVTEGDPSFLIANAFGLFVILGSLLIFSVIYRNFRRRSVGG